MLTIKAEVQQDKQRSDGTYNVKMRFTLDRKVKRLSTNLFVTPQDLTKSFKFKENTPIKKEIDCLVLYYREQCEKLHLDQNKYTLEEIISVLNGEQEKQQTIDFIKFSREWIALQLMSEGAKWKLYIPSDLGYGARGAGEMIPPHSTLIFEVELLEVL